MSKNLMDFFKKSILENEESWVTDCCPWRLTAKIPILFDFLINHEYITEFPIHVKEESGLREYSDYRCMLVNTIKGELLPTIKKSSIL